MNGRGTVRAIGGQGLWIVVVALLSGGGCRQSEPPALTTLRAPILGAGSLNVPDCNDPNSHDRNCAEPTKAFIDHLHSIGDPYYIGHAEPATEFFSNSGTSGYNMQWKVQLPSNDPTPTQDGTKIGISELYGVFWLSLALCDPNSSPFGACTPLSDANNPSTAGAAFLELQFFPNCDSDTTWCALLHINTAENNGGCGEPTTAQFLTIDGTVGHTRFDMNNGDNILVTMRDTANGLETLIQDQTTATSGTMIASKGNGFVHNVTPTACDTEPFDFHALYKTASTAHIIPWLNLAPNVSVAFEIGHFELCSDATCSVLPPEAQTGTCSVTNTQTCNTNHGNADCPSGETCNPPCGFQRGVAGCFVQDLDHDGNSYLPEWPDGSPNHPSSLLIGSADGSGVGPMSTPTTNLTNFNEGYSTILFATTESTTGAFYPFYTQSGAGPTCQFNFGNDIPDFTMADFGKAAQYTRVDLPNPCFPGVRETSLTYNGDTQNDFDDQATLAATLVDSDVNPVVGATVTFTLGSQGCTGVTDGLGRATCTVVLNQTPAPETVTATFAGDPGHLGSTTTVPFTIVREETVVAYTGPTLSNFDNPVTVSGLLTEDGVTPISGRLLSFTLDSGGSCLGTTNAAGSASCALTPTEPAGTFPITVSFAGDAFFLPSSASASLTVCSVPVFTFVPPPVSITSCNAPNIGRATATGTCNVRVTNNAPAKFPLGDTVVTWTATNDAGGTATATQVVTASLANDPSCCPTGTHIIIGTSNNDTLNGTAGSDCILGLGGQDHINGNGGDDFISGGDGDDVIDGGSGNDRIYGGTGQDQITGGTGNDFIDGGPGDDTCHGGDGDDVIHGGDGQDHLFGDGGNNQLFGDGGDDTLTGGPGNDLLNGGGLHDICIGGGGTNTFVMCQTIR